MWDSYCSMMAISCIVCVVVDFRHLRLFVFLLTFGIYAQALSLDREGERLSSGMWDELIRQHSTSPTSIITMVITLMQIFTLMPWKLKVGWISYTSIIATKEMMPVLMMMLMLILMPWKLNVGWINQATLYISYTSMMLVLMLNFKLMPIQATLPHLLHQYHHDGNGADAEADALKV